MFFHRKLSGFAYVNPVKLVFSNLLYPNFYLSVIYFVIRKSKLILSRAFGGHTETTR